MAIRAKGAPPRRQGNWQNKVLARVVVEALGYNPAKHFKAIKSPIFFRLASKDHLCPPDILHALLDRGHVPEVRLRVSLQAPLVGWLVIWLFGFGMLSAIVHAKFVAVSVA